MRFFNILHLLGLFMVVMIMNINSVKAQSGMDETTMEEVMASHDTVMDEMPNLVQLIGKLETKAKTSTDIHKYQNAIADLKSSNKSMMDWMAGFGQRFEADEMMKGKKLSEEKQKWLLEEKKKIAIVKEEIASSISQAEALLEN